MQSHYLDAVYDMLEKITIPYILQNVLEELYHPPNQEKQNRLIERIEESKRRIAYFANKVLKGRYKVHDLATPHTPDSNVESIAEEAAIYFQQGYEMLQTSQNMPLSSNPLVEYYGYLQCVKGIIILNLNVNKKHFFAFHGLTSAKTNSQYINIQIKPRGVFSALLLYQGSTYTPHKMKFEDAVDYFYSSSYTPSLEEIVREHYGGDPIFIFIGSWMLSSLVRYNPLKWKEILDGKKDDIISGIRDFRRIGIYRALESLLGRYVTRTYVSIR